MIWLDNKLFGCQLSFLSLVVHNNPKQTSCLTTAFLKTCTECVCLWSCVLSWPVYCSCSCHMPGRTTRRCKETLLQVKERLTREQADRTRQRISELLVNRDEHLSSDSEEDQENSTEENCDSLLVTRRDLYLGLLCLLLLILLLAIWLRSISLRLERVNLW